MKLVLALLTASIPIVASDFFEMRVRPILAKNCFACHTKAKMGGLDLSSRATLLQGGRSGPAIKPGDPASSLLLKAVRHEDPRLKMPPNGSKLTDAESGDIATWIRDGAPWTATTTAKAPTLWSLQPIAAPKQKNVDAFTKAAPKADKRILLRRVTYDLTGLPPAPEEMDSFLADKSPNAYAKAVDRLLASPQYGEKWARHWLDVARYSDDKLNSERDEPWPHAFRYRDWVVKAFNDDMPYDTFVKAHIAADQLDRADLLPALGIYGLRPDFQDDRVDVTTRGFLAMTVACAQCHDHKFDPIPTKDFYALQGVFNNTTLKEYPLADKATVDAWDAAKKELDNREKLLREYVKSQGDTLADIFANQSAAYLEAARTNTPGALDTEHFEIGRAHV